ncbi:MAG TPA: hypothetical protein VE736_08760 [Gaiellaceae bacterium]|nr:hypothetical protein [Gaiellaceae bacterium]
MAPRFAVRQLEDVPRIPTEADDPEWYPLQHYFGFTAFGVNVYVARADGGELLAEHDEAGSNQEELYLVTAGDATFVVDGERFDAPASTVVAAGSDGATRGYCEDRGNDDHRDRRRASKRVPHVLAEASLRERSDALASRREALTLST